MKEGLKDLLRLAIVVVVLCAFVYMLDYPAEEKRELYFGVVGGGVTAFFLFFIIKKIRDSKKK